MRTLGVGLLLCLLLLGSRHGQGDSGPEQSQAVTLYFVRHGETNTNVKGLLVGTSGNPQLTENGRNAALALGRGLRDVKFDGVYTSTLERAYDTAAYILEGAEHPGLTIYPVEELKDISWGDAEGMTLQELNENFGVSTADESFGAADDPDFVSPVNAETKYAFCNRFEAAINEIIRNYPQGGTVLVVAHSSMDFYFQKYFPGQAGQGLKNVSVTILKYGGGTPQLVEYNSTEYLQRGQAE